jgi:small subunit ribosomal protein S8
MALNDPLADALSAIKNAQSVGKKECTIRASKLIGHVLKIMQEQGYIGTFEFMDDGKSGEFKLNLTGNINECGAIKPRFSVKHDEFAKWESRYLPGEDFGVLIMTTTSGVVAHTRAKEMKLGGKLLAYVY